MKNVKSLGTSINNSSLPSGVFFYDTFLFLNTQSLFRLASPTTTITIIIRSFALWRDAIVDFCLCLELVS